MKDNVEDFLQSMKFNDLLHRKEAMESRKRKNCILTILAVIGSVAAVAAIAYAVYRYFTPDYLDDFDDDFDDLDDFDDFEDFDDEDIFDSEPEAALEEDTKDMDNPKE